MITYSITEIILSIISAIIYGVIFAIFSCFLSSIFPFIKGIAAFPKHVLFYIGSIKALPKRKNTENTVFKPFGVVNIFSSLKCVAEIVLFFLGLVLVSYAFCDGEIRLYMLLLSAFALYASKKTAVEYIFGIISGALFFIYVTAIFAFRVAFLPLRVVCVLIRRILLHFEDFLYKKMPSKPILTLDNKYSKML